jgi:hypothetical protein
MDDYDDNEGPRFDADEGNLAKRLSQMDQALDAHWAKWRTTARESFNFVAGRQWDEQDRALMEENNRIPVTFNRIETTIDAVSGAEIMGRQEVTYLPREVNDSGLSDVLSQGAQYVRQQCDAEDEESDAFRDCLICGIGVTQTRPSYDMDPDGEIIIERIDPLEVSFDPGSVKANFADARYLRRKTRMSREECEALFGDYEDYGPVGGDDNTDTQDPIIDNPRDQYAVGDYIDPESSEIEVAEYQWFDEESFYRIPTPQGEVELDEAALAEIEQSDPMIYEKAVRQTRRIYRRAFRVGGRVKDPQDIASKAFTYIAITGKRDRNHRTYYGLVEPMKDPQRFANKFLSSMIDQYVKSAKGGVMMEARSVDDIRGFEESWAKNDAVTLVPDGALSNPNGARIQQKPVTQISPVLPALLEYAVSSIRDVTGVNLEVLGMADRQQAGVLEHQRKQAAYGILAAFFNSQRRYRKMQGRLLLTQMQLYLPESALYRIVGDDGEANYVKIAYQPNLKFDVIVDEAPTSPNQKERTFAILTQMLPLLQSAPPEIQGPVAAEVLKFSPLPASTATKIGQLINQPQQPSPEQQMAQQMQMAGQEQQIRKTASEASKNEADVVLKQAQAQQTDMEAARDLTETLRNQAEAQLIETVSYLSGQPGQNQ